MTQIRKGEAGPLIDVDLETNPLVVGPGEAGSVVTCSFAPGSDLLLPAFATTIWVPVMTGDCSYVLRNGAARPGATVGFAGPFTGGQLSVFNQESDGLFGLLDPGGHWGVALYNGTQWVRYASGA